MRIIANRSILARACFFQPALQVSPGTGRFDLKGLV